MDITTGALTGQPTSQSHSQHEMPNVKQPTALNPVPSSPPNEASRTHSLQVVQSPWQPVPIPPAPSQQPPSAIETYAFYLKFNVYLRQKFPTYGKWPPNPSKKYINLALIKKQRMSKEEMDHFTKQTIHGDIDDIVHEKQSISMEEIGKEKGNTLPKCILVEGAPGVGKSTFAWKLCRKWSKGKLLQQYRLVVLLRLRDKRVREAKTVSDLFYYFNRLIQQTVVEEIQATGGRGVLLLFEGYDELPAKLRTSSSIFLEVIKGQELPSATILITSRPSASGPLYRECRDYIAQHVQILGFTNENVESYLEGTVGHNPSLLQGLRQYLRYYPHIRSMLYIPLNCAIVVEVYRVHKRDKSLIPKTWTDFYTSLLRSLLLRYLDDHPVHQRQSWKSNSFRDLPTDVYQKLCELGRIAYEGILQDQQVIFSNLPSDFSSLGLMQCVPELYVDEVAAESFNFLHLTLQEYMAALHLSEQPVEKQIEVFQKYIQPIRTRSEPIRSRFSIHQERDNKSNSHFKIVLLFLVGLRKFLGYTTSRIKSLLTDNEQLSYVSVPSSKIPISLDGLHWIFEAQDTSNVCEAIGMSVATVVAPRGVTSFDCFVLGYCVSHSNCSWEIDLSGCGIGDEGVEMFIQGAVEGETKHSGYISVMKFGGKIWGNDITSAGLNQLLYIPDLLKIRELDLSRNPLGRGGAVSLLTSPLVDNLEDLRLEGTGIGVEDCHALSELLSSSPTLRRISISHNDLPPEVVELIIAGLKHHPMLEKLDIGGSQFNVQNCISLSLVTQPPRHLVLANCHIEDVAAMELAGLINQNTVRSLDLQGNFIGVRGVNTFVETLPLNTSLRELHLSDTSIDLEGTQKLINCLSQNSTLEKLGLPGQYESYVDTSEVYRRVKDRIHWGGKWFVLFPYAHYCEISVKMGLLLKSCNESVHSFFGERLLTSS